MKVSGLSLVKINKLKSVEPFVPGTELLCVVPQLNIYKQGLCLN